jgi:hypothetical protein
MNGPAHYQEAEKNLAEVDFIDEHEDRHSPDDSVHESKVELLAQAQAHATLALVAATVWANLPYTLKAADGAELWREATS